MKKVIAIVAIVVLVIVGLVVYERLNRGQANNDGIAGVITFEKIGSDTGYGMDIDQGEFPIDIDLVKGELNIKISIGNKIVFEEKNIVESKSEVINIPESGYYIFTISGKNATGTIKYPVTENAYTPEIVKEIDNIEGIVKDSTQKYFEMVYEDKIEDIKINNIKIYEGKEKEEILEYVDLAENDYAFEIDVELKPANKDAAEEITEALGEYNEETGLVIEKEGFGVMRYNVISNEYDVTSITRK